MCVILIDLDECSLFDCVLSSFFWHEDVACASACACCSWMILHWPSGSRSWWLTMASHVRMAITESF
ncbi:hypothetical protein BHE74_00038855 [Ensete ventricosum]|nr:hypothetical protein GW17_00027889 [Ensete ventricosum]RWW54569.1 hypothetical protein BHE74_00038855 [Ensete ventricosum]RZR98480.1 hypothetical protein BHM03_00027831 [Ensete ventricosum]